MRIGAGTSHNQTSDANAAKPSKVVVDNRNDSEHFKNQFSVHRIRELAPDFNKNQKQWINDAGVGALLSLSEFSIPVKLVKWMMKHIDPLLSEFRFYNKIIVFDRPLVCKILGLQHDVQPLKLSPDVENIEIVLEIRDQYREGERAKIKKCIEVLKGSKNRESFMRAFMLLALGTVYCLGTSNGVSLKYLHSLLVISQIVNYDWAGHIIEVLMDEVKKYQKFSSARLQQDHQIGSCLAILVIAYIDHLDIPTDRGTHQINYDVPRICNVSNKDFDFIMNVDKSRLQLNAFGRVPFRSNTPYSTAPIINQPIINEEAPVISSASLDEWLHPSNSFSQFLQQLPPEHQKIVVEYNNLAEHDIDELAASFKAKSKEIWRTRCCEMMSKIINLKDQNQDSIGGAANASSGGKDNENEMANLTSKVAGIGISNGTNITNDSGAVKPTDDVSKWPKFCNDMPSFDLLHGTQGGTQDSATRGDLDTKSNKNEKVDDQSSPVVTPPPAATTNKDGTSTREKKNRRKMAAVNLNPKKKPKRIKIDKDTNLSYIKYLNTRILKKTTNEEDRQKDSPPFVRIAGFHVSYDEFYEALKPREKINTEVMTLWTYQFNLDEIDKCKEDNSLVNRFAFFPLMTAQLLDDPSNFKVDSFMSGLFRLNNTWDFARYDLMFFPIVHKDHWVLTCINLYRNQINFVNSIDASKSGPYFQAHNNLTANFSRAAMESRIFKQDISKFEYIYPTEYPQQSTLSDCGLYIMLYMESWDGKKMDTPFQSSMIADYRKLSAGCLLLSSRNDISADDFVKEHCVVAKNKN